METLTETVKGRVTKSQKRAVKRFCKKKPQPFKEADVVRDSLAEFFDRPGRRRFLKASNGNA